MKTDDSDVRTKVLIAEDEPRLGSLLRRRLERDGYRVALVRDGAALRTRLEHGADADVVISDIRMPGCSGLEALERLRERDWSLPVILMSGFVDDELRGEARRLGARCVLEKPFDPSHLQAAVRDVVPPILSVGPEARAGTEPGGRPRVLLAEDDDELRSLLEHQLVERGMDVVACRHGLELVVEVDRAFGASPSDCGERVDLVITDVRMPGVTGLSVLEGLHDLGDPCPLILITAFGDDETHARARRLHAEAVFDKPFSMQRLLDRVDRVLEGIRSPHSIGP